ncbi:MAG TPA: hypothetical protein VGJ05_14255 [Fimbriiglobus sp.]
MRYFVGVTMDEAAELLGISIATATATGRTAVVSFAFVRPA